MTKTSVSPAEGKLGILCVGLGAVTTTFMTGVLMARRGLAKPIGSMTQYDKIRVGRGEEKQYLHYNEIVPLANLSDLVFGLNFDSTEAHLVFPAEVAMVSTTTDANGELTLEELGQAGFAYTYDLATTSGTLTATDNDVTGETIDMTIDFTYDVPTDGIIVYLPVAFDDATNATPLVGW